MVTNWSVLWDTDCRLQEEDFGYANLVAVAMINICSPCHQEFWVHHTVELLPSEQATCQRTPNDTGRDSGAAGYL